MKSLIAPLVAGLFFVADASALSAVPGAGVFVSASTSDNCPSYCQGGLFTADEAGGEFSSTASAQDNTYGTAVASASVLSNGYLTESHAYAQAGTYRLAQARTFTSQAFEYVGTEATTRSIDFALSGVTWNASSGYTSNRISAEVGVFVAPALNWYPSFGTFAYEANAAVPKVIGYLSLTGAANADATRLEFTLQPGDVFFVVTELLASSQGGYADAGHTLASTISSAESIVAIPMQPVPELSTLSMFGLGIAAGGMLLRRRTRSAA